MKKYIIPLLILIFGGGAICLMFSHPGRHSIEEIHNSLVLDSYCGFDNLDGGYYHVKDLKTGEVKRIDVDIRDCSVYSKGDTIK